MSESAVQPHSGPAKRGRPSSLGATGRSRRAKTVAPKEKVCIFTPCKWEGKDDLHQVLTLNRGEELLNIKKKTNNDHIRSCLSGLEEAGDAAAQEKYYHSNCLRDADRTCIKSRGECALNSTSFKLHICDRLLVMSVQTSISTPGVVLTMNDINTEYLTILAENNIVTETQNHKRHLKPLLQEHIPEIEFVKSPRRNESEHVMLSKSLEDAVDSSLMNDPNVVLDNVMQVAHALRTEILNCREEWKFRGSLCNFTNPPLLQFFMTHLLFGSRSKSVYEKRDNEMSSTANMLCQMVIQNIKTDRQVQHTPKSDVQFTSHVETPLSVGIPLAIHQKSRNKSLVSILSSLYLGNPYKTIMRIEDSLHTAIVARMTSSGGYCLPDFVKKGKSVYFAADNIDLLEDTPFGQNTTHGTILVINQEEASDAESLNSPLVMPEKRGSAPSLSVELLDEPVVIQKPLHFRTYVIGQNEDLLKPYYQYDQVWASASYLVISKEDISVQEFVDLDQEPEASSNEATLSCKDDAASAQVQQPTNGNKSTNENQSVHDVALAVPDMNKKRLKDKDENKEGAPYIQDESTKKVYRKKFMPTWAATNSLLIKAKGLEKECTNSGVIAPLIKSPPTDMATLYTVLQLASGISAKVVGPQRRTVITLDLDLYERAIKLQQSVDNNWVLRAGELHICFAALHALGKYVEGSGLDSIAIETGVYSPAALRGIYGAKAFKRGVEYHLTNLMACFFMKLDAISKAMTLDDFKQKAFELKASLHDRKSDSLELFEHICSSLNKDGILDLRSTGELAQFLENYMVQIQCLLHIISTCRQGDWEGYLAALDKQIKYYFAHDLYHYARMLPVHLAQMYQLKDDDIDTWNALKDGDFCVRKSGIPFTDLFVDQTLEQHIRKLKGLGGIRGISQNEDALQRFMVTSPHLSKILEELLDSLPRSAEYHDRTEHYQLTGTMAVRINENAKRIKDSIQLHCEGNPFGNDMPLRNIVSSLLIPDGPKEEILQRDIKGQEGYKQFVEERLLLNAPMSIWDQMKKLKLKTHGTWIAKTHVRVADKVIKLREERQLLARFLVVQQSRPDLVPCLPSTIGEYELSIIPRSLFAVDGSLLIPSDKASLMHAIEDVPLEDLMADEETIEIGEFDHVLIVDAMAIVQSMKKTSSMTKMLHLKEAFLKRISKMMRGYDEGRIIFDRYIVNSLKNQTRSKRATSATAKEMEFVIHDEMSIAKISLKELLSSSKTKTRLSEYLAEGLMDSFKGSNQRLMAVHSTTVLVNEPHKNPDDMSDHSHEEADTMIPLHVIDALKHKTVRVIDVYSPDTDVLLLLMDLVASEHVGAFTKINFKTGRGAKQRSINICQRVQAIGREKSKGLIGIHNFSGADWGGKFVGISKKTWITAFLSLTKDDPAIEAFQNLGRQTLGVEDFNDLELPHSMQPLEKFLCKVYSPKCAESTISALRWELFRGKNLEGEKLPPTRGAFIPHLLRCNYMAMRDKSYTEKHPNIPTPEGHGWNLSVDENQFDAVKCLRKPAPAAVLELVKCGCKKCASNCSCLKNKLACTALCKCHDDCDNFSDYRVVDDDDL